jgi:hypothetical protein
MLAVTAVITIALTGGMVMVAILVSQPDAGIPQAAMFLLRGLILIAPVSLVLLPALAFLLHGRRQALRWLLLPASFVAGQWWGRVIAPYLYADTEAVTGLFGMSAGVGGLIAAMVFARWLRRAA